MTPLSREEILARLRALSAQPGDPDGPGAKQLPPVYDPVDLDEFDEPMRAYVSRMWAVDWDSAEDSVYDG